MARRNLAPLLTALLACAPAPGAASAAAGTAAARACPTVASPAAIAGTGALQRWNRAIDDFGVRTTGSPNHVRYVDWLERRFDSVPGIDVRSLRYRFHRWQARSASLRVDARRRGSVTLQPAGPVPYSRSSARERADRAARLPARQHRHHRRQLGAASSSCATWSAVAPNSVFDVVAWSIFDPRGTLDPDGIYKRDWLNGQPAVDMAAAGKAGAAGLLFVHEFPRAEIHGHYRPYEGIHWKVPGAPPRRGRGRAGSSRRSPPGRPGPAGSC